MCAERNLTRFAAVTYRHLRSLGGLFWIPPAVINGVMPLLSLAVLRRYAEAEVRYAEILQYTLWLFPFFSVWWSLFIMREYVESEGNEVLYLAGGRSKLTVLLPPFLLCLADEALVLAVLSRAVPGVMKEFWRIGTMGFCYFGVVYFLLFLSGTVLCPLMVLLLYTLISAVETDSVFPAFYVTCTPLTAALYKERYLAFLLLGLVCLVLGFFISRRYTKYR